MTVDTSTAEDGSREDPPLGVSVAPSDDAGSQTAQWYEFQYHAVARHCCQSVFDEIGIRLILCEWHTDYVLVYDDDRFSLVSVKHREKATGRWTIATLCSDGGLATLRQRWDDCGRPAECRLVTNAGLDPKAKALKEACARSDHNEISAQAVDLCSRLQCTTEEAAAFLRCLRIEDGVADKSDIRASNIERYAVAMVTHLGMANSVAWGAYDAVVQLVESAARGSSHQQPVVGSWVLSAANALDEANLIRAEMSSRIIRPDQVRFTVLGSATAAVPLLRPGRGASGVETRLTKKLRAGGVPETMVNSARRSRRAWTEYEAKMTAPLPAVGGADLVDDLRTRVLHAAGIAQVEAQIGGGKYGSEMLKILNSSAGAIARDLSSSVAVDPIHLMGLAFNLTDQCEIWWSEPFDPDETSNGSLPGSVTLDGSRE